MREQELKTLFDCVQIDIYSQVQKTNGICTTDNNKLILTIVMQFFNGCLLSTESSEGIFLPPLSGVFILDLLQVWHGRSNTSFCVELSAMLSSRENSSSNGWVWVLIGGCLVEKIEKILETGQSYQQFVKGCLQVPSQGSVVSAVKSSSVSHIEPYRYV